MILKKILRNGNCFFILQDERYYCIITTVQINLNIKIHGVPQGCNGYCEDTVRGREKWRGIYECFN